MEGCGSIAGEDIVRVGAALASGFARLEGRVSLDDDETGAVEKAADAKKLHGPDGNCSAAGKGIAAGAGGI